MRLHFNHEEEAEKAEFWNKTQKSWMLFQSDISAPRMKL